MTLPNQQRGVALIVVLLLLAVMISVAATMSQRMFSQFQRASHQLGYQQAYWYTLGVEALAKAAIEQSYQDSDLITLNQPWAQSNQTYPLDYGQVTGSVFDAQACFNLNVFQAVVANNEPTPPYIYRVWRALLDELDVDNFQAETIADSTWDFIDADDRVNRSNGAEDSMYEAMQPAYLPPNALLADVSELRAVYQVSGEVMHQLRPYLCALPSADWRLNINTLSADQAKLLVAMFSPYLSEDDAVSVLESRPFDGWDSVASFLAESVIAAVDADRREEARAHLSVDSQYFELDAQVTVDSARVRIRSLFYSSDKKDATVVSRRYGGVSERKLDRSTE